MIGMRFMRAINISSRINLCMKQSTGYGRSRFADGMAPSELWGVATRDMNKPRRKRGEAARARRKAKRQAKALGMTLKGFLRAEKARGAGK